jgi:hypothetical protein
MIRPRAVFGTSVALLAATSMAPSARSEERSRKGAVTFTRTVETPGGVLAPGNYVFRLLEGRTGPAFVEITSADEKAVHATVATLPAYRERPAERTTILYYELPGGEPPALRSWFCPGDRYGRRFAYPEHRATEIARLTGQSVPLAPSRLQSSLPPARAWAGLKWRWWRR